MFHVNNEQKASMNFLLFSQSNKIFLIYVCIAQLMIFLENVFGITEANTEIVEVYPSTT